MKCNACGLDAHPMIRCGQARRIAEYKASLVVNAQIAPVIVVANISKHGVYADKDKRRIYMRDYMANRRQCITNSPPNSKH